MRISGTLCAGIAFFLSASCCLAQSDAPGVFRGLSLETPFGEEQLFFPPVTAALDEEPAGSPSAAPSANGAPSITSQPPSAESAATAPPATAAPTVCPHCGCARCKCPETPQPCQPCPRVNNLNPAWTLIVGGAATMDALYHNARPIAPGTPFLLAPRGPFDDDTFDIHARSTTLYLAGKGPKIGELEAGGLVVLCLYNDSITTDRYGILPFQAYGELKNETNRIAAGLQLDIFAPVIPTVLPFSILAGTGNTGMYRGQLRFEEYFHLSDEEQITLTLGISDANPTLLANDVLTEDNGWPNAEARIAWSAGELAQAGLVAQRPFEVGLSGVGGEIRSTDIGPLNRVVANVWGAAGDWRWRVNECWGFAGEVYTGQGLGTYAGGVLQSVNSTTFEAVRTSGGWAEIYYYLTPCLHTHWGYAVDDPINRDLALTQVARNETIFSNLLWDVTTSLRLGFEFTYRETDYVALPDNSGIGAHGQVQWKF